MSNNLATYPLKKHVDERGYFSEILRTDMKEMLGEDHIVQVNLSVSYPGIIRAWHRHKRGQDDFFLVVRGALKICTYDDESRELEETVSTGDSLQIVKVYGRFWHGFKVVGDQVAYLIYFVNNLYDYQNPDEERRPWDDPSVVPRAINGSTNDPRCGKQWDWFFPPHR